MFLRRLGKRGTAIVEYAIILVFAAAVGSSFTSDNGMTGSIKSIIGNVNQMLGVAAGKEESKVAISENAKQWSSLLNDLYGDLMDLNPNKDKNLMRIKIYETDTNTGISKIEFLYYDGTKSYDSMNLTYSVGENNYFIKSQSFIRYNKDGSLSIGEVDDAPTRIQIAKQGKNNAFEFIGYQESQGGFFVANGYFPNVNHQNWSPKP